MIIVKCRVGATTVLDGRRIIYRRVSPGKGGVTTSALLNALRIDSTEPGDHFVRVRDYAKAVECIQNIKQVDLRHSGAKQQLSSLWSLLYDNVYETERL